MKDVWLRGPKTKERNANIIYVVLGDVCRTTRGGGPIKQAVDILQQVICSGILALVYGQWQQKRTTCIRQANEIYALHLVIRTPHTTNPLFAFATVHNDFSQLNGS